MKKHELFLKKNKEFSLIKGHPWVYHEAFKEIPAGLKTGGLVDVYSHKNQWLGTGYADADSKILVRMLPLGKTENPIEGIKRLVREAIDLRKGFFNSNTTNSCRLINGEGDFLPGLIVDRYDEAISMQIYSLGLEPFVAAVVEELTTSLPQIKWIWRRNQIRLAKHESASLIKGKHLPEKIIFLENGLKYSTDLVNGQKTGFFLDQRDNRQQIRELAKNCTFLNVCGYTGAFTVAAAAGGATRSVTVDIARPALEEAEQNLLLNRFSTDQHKLVCQDMYEYLKNEKRKFDLVVLDPPSMAKNRKDAEKAIRAYQKLNILGLKVVKPGGILFTASCTSQVGREEFLDAVKEAAFKANRRVQVVKEAFHAFDHPFSLAHAEGRYLKGLYLRVF
jgi:23S rRNA (cytosine1962-C5)-methyltransferase